MKPHPVRRALVSLCVLLLLVTPASSPSVSDDGVKSSLKKAGESLKSFGKKVGEKGAEAGREVAGAAKKIWYKGKRVSKPLLDDVQRSTRQFWQKVIDGKDRTIDQLREENERLEEQVEDAEDDD